MVGRVQLRCIHPVDMGGGRGGKGGGDQRAAEDAEVGVVGRVQLLLIGERGGAEFGSQLEKLTSASDAQLFEGVPSGCLRKKGRDTRKGMARPPF